MVKLHLGCGLDLRRGYINIDIDGMETMLARYQGSGKSAYKQFEDRGIPIYPFDILNLPFVPESVDEILSKDFLEHLSFDEERRFFLEVKRILKPNGILHFGVPDFEFLVEKWLNAKDQWKDFYYYDRGEHWFGQHDRNLKSRWGYLTALIFGNQNGAGQYHKNAYSRGKIEALLEKIEFDIIELKYSYYREKGERMLECIAQKRGKSAICHF